MSERLKFWIMYFKMPLIIKFLLYYAILPIVAWVTGYLGLMDSNNIEGAYVKSLYMLVPITSCYEIMVCTYEYSYGKISPIIRHDRYKYVILITLLLINVCFIYPISYMYFSDDGIDEIMKLEIITVFMSGLSVFIISITESLTFCIAVILGYTLISNAGWISIMLEQDMDMFVLTAIRDGDYSDSRQMDFLVLGCIFWIVGFIIIKKKKS